MLVIAAAGNFVTPACPACVRAVVGAGFQRSHRAESNGVVVTVNEAPRQMDGVLRFELLVDEPEGIDGTSYAAPLASGFAALLPDPAALAVMARLTWALTPVTILAGLQAHADPAQLPPGAPSTLHQGLVRMADAFPPAHRHFDDAMTTQPCGICALLLVPWYQTFVSMLIATSASHHALPIARIGAVLAPDSAPIWRNFGLAAQRVAAQQEDSAQRSQLLAEADMAYARATELDPTSTIYQQAIADVRTAASKDS